MSATLHVVTVRGKASTWCVHTYITKETAQDWREDGLEVYEVANTIPAWAVDLGIAGAWCFVQDVFHFKNPWRKP